jgi:hypothetical protein
MNFFLLFIRANSYNAVNYQRTLDRVFRHAWIVIVVVFVVQLANDLVFGFYGVGVPFLIILGIYSFIVGIGALVISILFLIYSHKLYRRLEALNQIRNLQQKNMDRVLYKFLILLCCLFVGCSMKVFVFLLLREIIFMNDISLIFS